MDDRPEVQLFRGGDRKALREVETHLMAEYRTGARSGTIAPVRSVLQHMIEKVEILLHGSTRDSRGSNLTAAR